MDLNLSSLGTLVPAATCYVFYATKNQIYRFDIDDMAFASTQIWYHTQTHTGHRGTNRLAHMY